MVKRQCGRAIEIYYEGRNKEMNKKFFERLGKECHSEEAKYKEIIPESE